MSDKLSVVYLGTPEFAVPGLQMLIENGIDVRAVVTAPDKPSGRGLQLSTSPVKDFALAHNVPVLQPEKLKAPEFLEQLKSYEADLQVVVAFRMLPELVWNMPRLGTFNLHASLLPDYRGAAPINWAIMNGETQTGLTTFFLQHEIDTGQIIFQETESILDADTAGTLYERLMHKGAALILKTVRAIQAGDYPQIPQPEVAQPKLAPKIFRETCRIDQGQTTRQTHDFVRGLSPYPTAWTELNGKILKVYQTRPVPEEADAPEAATRTDGKSFLHLRTADGWLALEEVQLEGKKRLRIDEFLRGNKL